ncbi:MULTISPECIES: hypothetical protein [Vagococcus]|uniref:hypothetical protein n=1 Tax=Vagococcus TaxID=2737 RepID=UPI0037951B3A
MIQKDYGLGGVKFLKILGIVLPVCIFIFYLYLYSTVINVEDISGYEYSESNPTFMWTGIIYSTVFYVFYQVILRIYINLAIIAKNMDKNNIEESLPTIASSVENQKKD